MALTACNSATDELGRELASHGTPPLPIACYHDDLSVDPVPWHWHEELELAIAEKGDVYFYVGTEKHLIRQGCAIFINASLLHQVTESGDSPWRLHSMCFLPKLVGGAADSVFWQNYLLPLLHDATLTCVCFDPAVDWQRQAIDAIENTWQACVQEKPGYEFRIRDYLSRLIFLLVSHRTFSREVPSEKSLRDWARIKLMLQYIHEHFAEEISVQQIAASAAISESEALRCFRSTIRTTPIQYVKNYRIRRAAGLLATGNQKITDIGTACGFQEMSYFTKAFRAEMGMTPTEYRQQKEGSPNEAI